MEIQVYKEIKILNIVCCLKLIWRITSSQSSLWVKWLKANLLRRESFWSVKEKTTSESWMVFNKAKSFQKVDIISDFQTSFWFEEWSNMGRSIDITGVRGCIDLGLPIHTTVATALDTRRRRSH